MEDSLAQRRLQQNASSAAGWRNRPRSERSRPCCRANGPRTGCGRLSCARSRSLVAARSHAGLKLEAGGKSARGNAGRQLERAFAFVQRLNAAQLARRGRAPWPAAGRSGIGPSSYRFSWRSDEPAGCVGQAPRGVGQCPLLARCRWHWQRWRAALGRGGLLALATAIVLAVHGAFVLWPEQGELRRQRIALIAQLQACHTPASAPAAAAMSRCARSCAWRWTSAFAVMEQLGGAGLLLIDIRYRGEDAVRGSLRRTRWMCRRWARTRT